MREVHEWTEAELDYLERFYALHGSAFIRARFPHLSPDAIRQQASRLALADDMREFTPAREVRQEAGVSEAAVLLWVSRRGYRSHCRTWGRAVLLPLPVVRLYLHERRVAVRPRGRWGSARAAEHAGVSIPTILKAVPHEMHGHTAYFRPEDVMTYAALLQAPPTNHVLLRALTGPGTARQQAEKWLKANGYPVRQFEPNSRAPLYVHADHARAFLSARGHREEQVETLLRRALALDVVKEG